MASSPAHARMSARHLLRGRRLWLASAAVIGLLSFLLSLLYLGANSNPVGAMHDLPIAVVNADQGSVYAGKQMNLGAQIAERVAGAPQLKGKVGWKQVDRAGAKRLMSQDKAFGALVVPENFSATVLGLAAPGSASPKQPTLEILTNPAAGSFGSNMAEQVNREAAHDASVVLGGQLGRQLAHQAAQAEAAGHRVTAPSAPGRLLLADPIKVVVSQGHHLGDHSGFGLTSFFYTLVLVLGGMLGANVIHMQVDAALGYAAKDLGPFRTAQPVRHLSRTRHFLVGCALMAGVSLVTSALAMAAAVEIIGIDASHLLLLWIFGSCATMAMGCTALALLAVLGTPGPLVSMLVLIGLAIPSAGATIPLQALPSFYRFLAEFEPFRQVLDGVRSILYFGAQLDAGLARAWTMTGAGLALSLLLGLGLTHFYDRRGLHRTAQFEPVAFPAAA
ncbi:DUF3533 domain-containing protein [Streptomyces sp. NPDC046197]|uniref:YhgE/Pip domain-containing protein n=1 Tax=Streptomyces sp. NPDC046197 TaxID=3154337 RepID=UPI00340055D7